MLFPFLRPPAEALQNIKLVLRTPHPAGGSPVSKCYASGFQVFRRRRIRCQEKETQKLKPEH
jgi:hypothetical protein